jgi:hypothetical protein
MFRLRSCASSIMMVSYCISRRSCWIGYKVRFSDHVSDNTMVKLMTDGILLAEIQQDRLLSRRGDDDFQVRTARQQLFQIAEQEVNVQAALVRFIDILKAFQ